MFPYFYEYRNTGGESRIISVVIEISRRGCHEAILDRGSESSLARHKSAGSPRRFTFVLRASAHPIISLHQLNFKARLTFGGLSGPR